MLKSITKVPRPKATKSKKKLEKMKVWNQCPPKLEKINFWSHFGLPKPLFFWDFGYKNEDGFLQHESKQKRQQITLPNPPPWAKAQWPLARGFGQWLGRMTSSNTPMAQRPANFSNLQREPIHGGGGTTGGLRGNLGGQAYSTEPPDWKEPS